MRTFTEEELSKLGFQGNIYPDPNAFRSHRPFLKHCVDLLYEKKGKLNILEVGIGDGSSEYFSEITKEDKANVWGIEFYPAFWEEYEEKRKELVNDNYQMSLEYDSQGPWVWGTPLFDKVDRFYDIIFIDSGSYENRWNWVKYASKGHSDIFMLHDSEHWHRQKKWAFDYIKENWKYVYDSWPKVNPGTVFGANFDLECNLAFEKIHDDLAVDPSNPHPQVGELDPATMNMPIQEWAE
jgi:hypothetical protein|tara:strand:- start:250 stop:963 length:714 start_codon:yes stop_codon:yes gene_type:complete